ncbi:GGDEF domain-containing protein [Exiguobacterium oxidotolerans]|uniref:GGDEF domain-containing protein n=1 Tax=Exiguobacterium oxidotolerans TaxID=223958 RepID=A0A653IEF3_9BACL|nr:sensor domain-containing diguanylate cyclase [Exiguobacterium oxidotolerans]VWX37619.1 GGDEF domain-containing protein [Exiguobacterium oxidotolerans]
MLILGIGIGILMTLGFMKLKKSNAAPPPSVELIGHHTKDIVYVFEVKPIQRFRYISPSLDEHLGEGIVAASYADPAVCFERVHPEDFDLLVAKASGIGNYETPFLQRWRTNEGHYIWFEEYSTPIYENGQLVAIQGIIRNVERAISEKHNLEQRCRTDALTGLYNRYQFDNMVRELVTCEHVPLGVLLFDLNDLKIQNDHHGHAAGDGLLKTTATILKNHSQNVYRIGGDEFAIIESHLSCDEMEAVRSAIHTEMAASQIAIASGLAMGAADDIEQLIAQADSAMYADKSAQKQLS